MWYSLSVNKLVSNVVWKKIRQPIVLDFCQSILTEVKKSHEDIFPVFYEATIDRSKWSSQTLVLEQILNEQYGYGFTASGVTNSIYITQFDEQVVGNFFYNQAEFSGDRPIYMGNASERFIFLTLYNQDEARTAFDFEVNMPIADDPLTVKQITNDLKIAGVKYKVNKY